MTRTIRALAIMAALAAPTVALAQDDESPNQGKVSVLGGIDLTTAYFFRGYNQEDQGLILQPYATLSFELCEHANAYVGTWNSIHDEQTLADPGSTGSWYESDLLVGMDVSLGDALTLGVVYTAYTYPGGAFDTIEEIGAKLAFDDSGVWGDGDFALNPYVGVYFETDDDNGTEDVYGEVGIAPTLWSDEGSGLSIGLPVAVGTSLEDYYFDDDGDDEFLGYVSVALSASLPLPIPSDYGAWALTGQVQYLALLADSAEALNHDDSGEIIGRLGVSFAY